MLREKLKQLIYGDSAVEKADNHKHLKMTAREAAMLAILAQVYKMPANQVIRRLIRQAAVDYAESGEVLALIRYLHEEVNSPEATAEGD